MRQSWETETTASDARWNFAHLLWSIAIVLNVSTSCASRAPEFATTTERPGQARQVAEKRPAFATEAPLLAPPSRDRALHLVQRFLEGLDAGGDVVGTLTTDAQLVAKDTNRRRPLLSALLERSAGPTPPLLGRMQLSFQASESDVTERPRTLLIFVRARRHPGGSTVRSTEAWEFSLKQTERGLLIAELQTEDGSLR